MWHTVESNDVFIKTSDNEVIRLSDISAVHRNTRHAYCYRTV